MTFANWLTWLTTGTSGFALYWSVFSAIALLECFGPRPATATGDRLRVNFGLGLIAAAVTFVPVVSGFAVAIWAKANGLGLFHALAVSGWAVTGLTVLTLDLERYVLHRASHGWRPLWRLHQIHHTDPAPDLSTNFRAHPLAVLVAVAADAATILVLGLDPLGILLFGIATSITMGLGHAQVPAFPGLSRIVSAAFVTPRFHRRHHSALTAETDSNYGEVLTVWDRVFGSASPMHDEVARFGLGEAHDHSAGSLRRQLSLPFKQKKEPGDPPQTVVAASFRT